MKLCCFVLLILAGAAHADDLTDLLGRSAYVGVAYVTAGDFMAFDSGELSECGSRYVAYSGADETFVNNIGWTEGAPIEFRAGQTLEVGGTYLLFLSKQVVSEDEAGYLGRKVRTERCSETEIGLVPTCFKTEFGCLDTLLQEWRVADSEKDLIENRYTSYFLTNLDFRAVFDPLVPLRLEIHPSRGPMNRDAYSMLDILKTVVEASCKLRGSDIAPQNPLRLAGCPE